MSRPENEAPALEEGSPELVESEVDEDQRKLLLILAAGLYHRDPLAMNAVPGVGMLSAAGAGAAALLGLTKPNRLPTAEEDTELECNVPDSLEMAQGELALGERSQQWFRSTTRSSCSSTLSIGSETDSGFQPRMEGSCTRALHEGSTVCFYARSGELLTVRPNGKSWELQPISGLDTHFSNEGARVQLFPADCLFVVMRREKYFGFRSLGAEGRSLQAVNGNSPHRCSNYNFGSWESWELSAQGLVNVKYPSKTLGFDIREVACVSMDELNTMQRGYLKNSRKVQQQLKASEDRASDADRKLKEALRAKQRVEVLHQREVEDIKVRLEEASKNKQRFEIDAMQSSATQKQLEMKVNQLTVEKDSLEVSHAQAQSRIDALNREFQLYRDRHEADMRRLERNYESETRMLRKDRDNNEKRTKDLVETQSRKLREEREDREASQKEMVKKLSEEHKIALREKDAELWMVVKECHRLTNILKKVKSEMDEARANYQASQATPQPPGGYPSWNHRPGHGFVPMQHGGYHQNPVDYMHRRSPTPPALSACSSMQLDGMDGAAPSCTSSMMLRNPRASPPASAVSGEWMVERNQSKSLVAEWIQNGSASADGTLGKQDMTDGSSSEVNEPSQEVAIKAASFAAGVPAVDTVGECRVGASGKGSLDLDQAQDKAKVFGLSAEQKILCEKPSAKAKWAEHKEITTVAATARDRDELNPPKASASA